MDQIDDQVLSLIEGIVKIKKDVISAESGLKEHFNVRRYKMDKRLRAAGVLT